MSRNIEQHVSEGKLFDDHYYGFVLHDLESDKTLFSHNGDHLFTPASNTKILTLLTALTILPDTLPSFYYAQHKDSLFVYGLGDPSTLNPTLGHQKAGMDFIDSLGLPTVFCSNHFRSKRFGSGWAWDDYPYGYQVEKSFFPLFGNALDIRYSNTTKSLYIYPNIVSTKIQKGSDFSMTREEHSNHFEISIPTESVDVNLMYPFRLSDSTLAHAFAKILNVPVRVSHHCPAIEKKNIFYSIPSASAYSVMMKESDNFIAEQLLLMSAGILTDTLSTEIAIRHMTEDQLQDENLRWSDGSGLSRYNLISPNTLIYALKHIYDNLGLIGIKNIFAAGGESGTIKNWYSNKIGAPFVYAKTGTLTGVHCLSGYLTTDDGKLLIFSMMHNNYNHGSTPIKEKMNKILQLIKQQY